MKGRSALAAAWLLAWPAVAWAHSPVPGLGRFYSGMLHPFLAPAAFIALAGLGILIGQQGLTVTRKPVLGFVLMLALGLVLGSQWPGPQVDTALLLVGAVSAAAALAAWRPPPVALLMLACALGLLAGWGLSDMAVAAGPQGRWIVIAGTWAGSALAALGVAAIAELARKPWQHIALRVVASWLTASALLVLGLQWAGPLLPAKKAPAVSVHSADRTG